ncbi:MAG: DUF5119 domain-containing protein [Rikenellaceae bacterium]
MNRILYILLCLLAFISCDRRELTYTYEPTVSILLKADWSDMSVKPTGMSVYCYPSSGESPTIIQTNIVDSTTLQLGIGEYKILVFNQVPSDFSTINFSGLSDYETAEVYAAATSSRWYSSKADEELVVEPDELAIATYHSVVVTKEAVDEILGLREQYDYSAEDEEPYITIEVAPKVVVKVTRVTVSLDGIHNLSAARSTLYGMSTGYKFSSQTTHSNYATHLLESWSKTIYEADVTQGEIVAYFTCFGLPETVVASRQVDESWGGTMHLEMLLVDNSTIVERDYTLVDKTTLLYESEVAYKSDDDAVAYDDSDVDISIDIEDALTLPDVQAEGGYSEGFTGEVLDWEDEQTVGLEI